MTKQYTPDDFIPMAVWGKDHWSTLGYIESVIVDANGSGFQVGNDPRMRANRRNFRVMMEECKKPLRPSGNPSTIGYQPLPMDKYGTRLNTGQEVFRHCDWCCVQDMANEGLFASKPDLVAIKAEDVQPGVFLHLTEKGQQIAAALRKHKAAGGQFAFFKWEGAS